MTAVSHNGFEIVWDSTLFSFDYQSIEGLERSIGTKRLWLEGILIGAWIPLEFGLQFLSGCMEGADALGPVEVVGKLICFLAGTAIGLGGAAIGAVVGGVAGFFIHREVWAPVSLDGRLGTSNPFIIPWFDPERRISLELGVRIRLP